MNTGRKKVAEEEEESPPELGYLNADAVRAIFSRIPLKPLIKLKRVSRTWRDFITDFHRRNPPSTATGLAVTLSRVPAAEDKPILQECIFLPPPPHKKRRRFKHNVPLFPMCSCNGLLLYEGGGENNGKFSQYILWDPFNSKCLAFPGAHETTCRVQVGLAFDGFGSDFLVVCIFLQEVDLEKGLMNCKIFSSEKWEWREIAARIQNTELMDIEKGFDKGFGYASSPSSSLYFDGRIYWIWSICMIQFDTGNETFKLFSLPVKPDKLVSPLLYESDGQIYFSNRYIGNSLQIFEFNDRAHDVHKWQLKRSLSMHDFPRIRPSAFNKDVQELILVVSPGRIVSYSLETGKFTEVCSCGEMELEGHTTCIWNVMPLLFKPVHLFDRGDCRCTASSEISYFTTKLFSELS